MKEVRRVVAMGEGRRGPGGGGFGVWWGCVGRWRGWEGGSIVLHEVSENAVEVHGDVNDLRLDAVSRGDVRC